MDSSSVNPFEAPASSEANLPTATSTEPALPIELTGDLSVDDYLRAWRLATWNTSGLWIRYSGRAALVAFGTFLLLRAWRSSLVEDWQTTSFELTLGITMFACLGWLLLSIRRHVRRHLTSMDTKLGDAPLVVDEQGVHIRGPALSVDYKWEGFEGYRTNGPVLVLYSDYPRQYLGLFEKHAASAEHWQLLKEIVSERLQKY